MQMKVENLLSFPHLGLELIAGRQGLGNEISWAYVSELANPVMFLEGGELILTGGIGIAKKAAEQEAYLRRLHGIGVSGVAIAQGRNAPKLTKRALNTADELSLPLLELPFEVPFLEIIHLVAAASERVAQQRLLQHLQVFETLQAYETLATPWDEVIPRLSAVTGFDLYLSTPAGQEALLGVPTPPDQVWAAIVESSFDKPTLGDGYCLPVTVAGRTAAYLVALRGGESHSPGLATAQYVAMVIGILFSTVYRERETQRRERAELFGELLAGEYGDSERAERLLEAGFLPGAPLVMAVVSSDDPGFDGAELHHRLCDRGQTSLMITRDNLIALVPDTSDATEALAGADFRVAIGLSSPFSPQDRLGTALREARWSLERALVHDQQLVRFSSEGALETWLPLGQSELTSVVDGILGSIIEYDDTNGSELIRTLQVLFKHDRRMKATARELGVHHHTVTYRINRIEDLTGRNLRDLHDVVDLWLALKALEMVSIEPAVSPGVAGRR